jgi:hypothetical protein
MAGCGCQNNPFYTVKTVRRRSRKTRKSRKQSGGFYPSVYSGISGATMLAPLVARQAMRLYNRPTLRKSRKSRKSKNKLRNKRG